MGCDLFWVYITFKKNNICLLLSWEKKHCIIINRVIIIQPWIIETACIPLNFFHVWSPPPLPQHILHFNFNCLCCVKFFHFQYITHVKCHSVRKRGRGCEDGTSETLSEICSVLLIIILWLWRLRLGCFHFINCTFKVKKQSVTWIIIENEYPPQKCGRLKYTSNDD